MCPLRNDTESNGNRNFIARRTRKRIRSLPSRESVNRQAYFTKLKKDRTITIYHRSFRKIHSHRTSIFFFSDFERVSFLLIQGSIGLWPTFDIQRKEATLLLSTTRIFRCVRSHWPIFIFHNSSFLGILSRFFFSFFF